MKFWEHLYSKLGDQQKVYVLTVIENHGSSPGRKGFKMLVAEDGFIFGSIGGGVMEFERVKEAQQLLEKKEFPTFIKKQIHRGRITNGSGMICSGEQTVAFHCLGEEDKETIIKILNILRNGEKACLALSADAFALESEVMEEAFEVEIKTDTDWKFKEHIGIRDTLHIVGGGHVGLALSELMVKLGFYVIIFDNRTSLNTFEENTFAHKKLVINYHEIGTHIPAGVTNYVAIMTNKYTEDKVVLSQLIETSYKFIGVLGSKAKLRTMWKMMLKEGVSLESLNAVHAPIGLSIKSETPEEIAVSIAAQIIQIKNQKI